MESFYKKELPEPLIKFSSAEGKLIFKEALQEGNMETYFELGEQYVTQAKPEDCGISSLVMVLNALGIDPCKVWKKPWRWYTEENLYCVTRSTKGLLFDEFLRIALCNKTWVVGFYPSSVYPAFHRTSRINCIETAHCKECNSGCKVNGSHVLYRSASLETFRSAIVACSRRSGLHMVVNFSRKVLNQTGSGHFSPVVGYNSQKDMCLVLEVARFKYPAFWCPVSLLYEALEPLDRDTGNPRGFFVIAKSSKFYPEVNIDTVTKVPFPLSLEEVNSYARDLNCLLVYSYFRLLENPHKDFTGKTRDLALDPLITGTLQDFFPQPNYVLDLVLESISSSDFEGYFKTICND